MKNFYKHTNKGYLINIKVVPNSSMTSIMGVEESGLLNELFLKIKISSPPNENKANQELIKFLSKTFDIPKCDISLIKGDKNKEKKLLLNLSSEDKLLELFKKYYPTG